MVTDEQIVRATLVDRKEFTTGVMATAADFLTLLRSLAADDANRPVPGLAWTVGDVAAHVVTVLRRGLDDGRRADSVEALGELNARCIDEIEEREPARLADMLEADLLAVASRGVSGDDPFELHAGVVADRLTASSYFFGDLLVHGYDIAAATGAPWTIPGERAAVCLRVALPAMRPWVRAEVVAGPVQRVALRFGGSGDAVLVEAGGGRYVVTAATAADGERDADPAAVLLAITGRRPSGDAVVDRLAGWFLPI